MLEALKQLRAEILDAACRAKEGHIPSSFSILEILYALYEKLGKDDEIFLSKGHGGLGLYVILKRFGYLTGEELRHFGEYDSFLGGHPQRNPAKGIMNSSGSLGHGLALAAGSALGKKISGESGRVFCIVGDGECNEGSVWEAALHAAHLGLSNLAVFVDNNKSQARAVPSGDLKKKFESFGWDAYEVQDGHDVGALQSTLKAGVEGAVRPVCIVADTVKGKGVKEMEEDMYGWHHRIVTPEECERFKCEIETL